MAQLSEDTQVAGIERVAGGNPIQGNPVGPSYVSGLAGLADTFVTGAEQRRQRELAVGDRNARNATESAIFDEQKRVSDVNSGQLSVQLDPSVAKQFWSTPGEVIKASDNLDRVQAAENNGVLPAGATQVHLEAAVGQLYQQFPDQKSEIATYIQGRGFDHYVFSDVKNQMDMQKTEEETRRSAYQQQFDYAVKTGAISPDTDFKTGAQTGQDLMNAHAQLAIAKDKAEIVLKTRELDQKDRDFQLSLARNQGVAAIVSETLTRMGPVQQTLNQLEAVASNNPERLDTLNKTIPNVINAMEQYRTAAKAKAALIPGVTAEHLKQIDDTIDVLEKGVNTVHNANYEVNKRALDGIQTNLKLDGVQSFGFYTELAGIVGQPAANEMFAGNPLATLQPDQRKRLEDELKNYQPGKLGNGIIMNDVIRLLRKDTTLTQMDAKSARDAIPHLVAMSEGSGKAILQGNEDQTVKSNWHTSYSNLTDAAFQLNPGTTDGPTYHKATYINSSPLARAVLEKELKDPTYHDQAMGEIQASRSAAQKLLIVGTAPSNIMTPHEANSLVPGAPPPFVVHYNKGQYELAANKQAYESWAAKNQPGMGKNTIPLPDWKTYSATTPVPQQQLIIDLNANLKHLVETSPYDVSIPKGAQQWDLRNHYALGSALTTGQGPTKTGGLPDKEFRDQVSKFNDTVTALPSQISTDPGLRLHEPAGRSVHLDTVNSAADQSGVPRSVLDFVVGQESSYDPKAGLGTAHVGLGQFDETTAKRFGLIDSAGNDHRTDPVASIHASAQYLNILHAKYGSWEKALHMYGTLGPKGFPGGASGQAYKDTVKRAKQAIGTLDDTQTH